MQFEPFFLSVFPEENENENDSEVESESESDTTSNSEDSEHELDRAPSTFLELTNQNLDRTFGAKEGVCDFHRDDDGQRKIIIPEISKRCLVTWPIGAKLAAGKGAVVYNVDCPRRGRCKKVARISQFRNPNARAKFVRDVEARYLLSCQCGDVSITDLIDAFICENRSSTFGVTISDQYDGTLLDHLLTLSSLAERLEFIEYAREKLLDTVRKMHKCGIFHRDMLHGNILVRNNGTELALTDFESAGGEYFNTRPNAIAAYMNSDINGVNEIAEGLVTICTYLDDESDATFDLQNVSEDFNLSMETLARLKKKNFV
jgi:tRNA A-37 threonylcarbamoyl transferase component Bud32